MNVFLSLNIFLSVKFFLFCGGADYFFVVVLSYRILLTLRKPKKDEFEGHLSCLVYHSTIGVFQQPIDRVFIQQLCLLSKPVKPAI